MAGELWPYRGQTSLDRARFIAMNYREALQRVHPKLCQALDDALKRYGELWLFETPITKFEDELHTAQEVAEALGVRPNTVHAWATRGHIQRYPTSSGGRYRLDEAQEYHWNRSRRRRSSRTEDA